MSELSTKIPGLVSIEQNEDGSIDLIVDDDKVEEFYSSLGLAVGDEKGLQELMQKVVEEYLKGENNVAREG